MENEQLEKTDTVTLRGLRKMIQVCDPKMVSSPNTTEIWISLRKQLLKSFLFSEVIEMGRWHLEEMAYRFLGIFTKKVEMMGKS